jgi:hypothetical protein
MGWFSKKTEDEPRIVLALIKGERNTKDSVGTGMAVLGFMVMLGAIVLESSAIRLAAWGAIWTGWNVLCAMNVLKVT